jgi:tetratricopeptide (TPR) repeat protein
MLTASASVPNIQNGETPRPAPTPVNWHGVTEGLNKAHQCLFDGLHQEAVNILKEVLEFAPSEPKAWKLLGEILATHGHTNKAAACHGKAKALESSLHIDAPMPASERLAKLLWTQGETDAARGMLAVLLLRDPESKSLLTIRDDWDTSANESQS